MKKRVLMSLVVLAIIGTSAVFAQQPTLDKLQFNNFANTTGYTALAANNTISGAVVIPEKNNGKPVTQVSGFKDCTGITSVTFPNSVTQLKAQAFNGCTGLTSITIPASVTSIDTQAFDRCTNLTSVTFQSSSVTFSIRDSFLGDLVDKYKAGGAGTYTRSGNTWTKQGGFSLNGVWTRSDGMKITITENGQNITITGDKPNNGGKLNDTYTKR